jgi:tetratricopeptide (TPR) repeat protein
MPGLHDKLQYSRYEQLATRYAGACRPAACCRGLFNAPCPLLFTAAGLCLPTPCRDRERRQNLCWQELCHPYIAPYLGVCGVACVLYLHRFLCTDNHLLAYELLKKAEILTSPSGYITDKKMRMKLRAVTFNNFGCFYKRRGKLHAALQYLAKALKIELTSEEVDNPAGTHLNLCATLSQLGRHGPALEHAQCALELLEAMADTREQKLRAGGGAEPDGNATDDGSIMAIAWHNMAVEQEHLNMLDASLNSYEQAVLIAEKEWGAGHIKTLAIKHSLEEARQKAAARRSNPKVAGGHGANASPLDAVLNPNTSSSGLHGFRQSGIKTKAASPGGKIRKPSQIAAIKAYGPNARTTKTGVSESWGEYLNETHMGGGGRGAHARVPGAETAPADCQDVAQHWGICKRGGWGGVSGYER